MFVYRQSHASYFQSLHAFDRLLLRSVGSTIRYNSANRRFYTECAIYAAYYLSMTIIKLFVWDRPSTTVLHLFHYCWAIETIVFGWATLHMKNCIVVLLHRHEVLQRKLVKFIGPQPSKTLLKIQRTAPKFANEYFHRIIDLYEALNGIQQRVQQAFGAILLFISIYNLFTITFSIYYVIYMNFRVSNVIGVQRRRITANFIIFDLPMVFTYVYIIGYFHRLGQRVSI